MEVHIWQTGERLRKHELKGFGWLDIPTPSKRKPCHCEGVDDVERLFDEICTSCPRRGISVVTISGDFG